jgi:hypothetical protein
MFMKTESADGQNESTEAPWPCVPKIVGTEFEQSVAVAQLAVKLCELQKRELQNKWEAEDKKYGYEIQRAVKESEKERVYGERKRQMESRIATLAPESFLPTAWQLIEKAGEHVLRAQTDAEYLAARGGSGETAENVVERILSASRVPFKKLCDPNYETKDDDVKPIELFDAETGMIHKIHWKVYRSERGFDDLFWAWWHVTSILKLRMIVSPEVPGNAPDKWQEYGKQKLASWKRDGVPPNDFLALAKFRREHDKRAENLNAE